MNAAVLLYRWAGADLEAVLAWIALTGQVLASHRVPLSPNLGLFPKQDCVLLAYTEYSEAAPPREWLEVYRLSDWRLRARLPMDCRAYFNVGSSWCPFVAGPGDALVYVYKARTLGHHLAEDFICGLDLKEPAFLPWNDRVPECVSGWSAAGGRAHAQMLFVADGLTTGRLPSTDLQQQVAFWLGHEGGMGPVVPIGPRPRAHSDPGHARAIVSAPGAPLSVVVCTDGTVHLLNPVEFRYVERQQVCFAAGQAMPIFAAQVDPEGQFLYVGTAGNEARCQGQIERVVVHDLRRGRRHAEWVLEKPFVHMALTENGKRLYGAAGEAHKLYVLEAPTGRVEAKLRLDGSPQYVLPVT